MLNGSEYRLVKEMFKSFYLLTLCWMKEILSWLLWGLSQTGRPFSEAVIEGKQRMALQRRLWGILTFIYLSKLEANIFKIQDAVGNQNLLSLSKTYPNLWCFKTPLAQKINCKTRNNTN